MKQLDLGSANALRGHDGFEVYGTDIVKSSDPRIQVCDLNIDPLPFEDDMFELVTAYDILEHIVPILYLPQINLKAIEIGMTANNKSKRNTYIPKIVRRSCMIELFNEIYRVMKHNAMFYTQTPINDFSDPTHVAHWTSETFHHFSGDYYGFHDHYGHTSRFEKIESHEENNHVYCTMRAIKTLPVDSEYKITYPEVTR